MDEKGNRRFERTDFNVGGYLTVGGKQEPIRVSNISLKGILVSLKNDLTLEIDSTYPLQVVLPHSDIAIRTEATLLHNQNHMYGFRFTLIDAEGMIHLRRLMELNSSSEDEIERELSFLGSD